MSQSSAYYAKLLDNLMFYLCVIHTKLLNTGIMLNYINGKPFLIILILFINNNIALKISIVLLLTCCFNMGNGCYCTAELCSIFCKLSTLLYSFRFYHLFFSYKSYLLRLFLVYLN